MINQVGAARRCWVVPWPPDRAPRTLGTALSGDDTTASTLWKNETHPPAAPEFCPGRPDLRWGIITGSPVLRTRDQARASRAAPQVIDRQPACRRLGRLQQPAQKNLLGEDDAARNAGRSRPLAYTSDFRDDGSHTITIEAKADADPAVEFPATVAVPAELHPNMSVVSGLRFVPRRHRRPQARAASQTQELARPSVRSRTCC